MNNSIVQLVGVLFLGMYCFFGAAGNISAQMPVANFAPQLTSEEIQANNVLKQAIIEYYDSCVHEKDKELALEHFANVLDKYVDIVFLEKYSPFFETLNRYLYFTTDETQTDPLMISYAKCLGSKITYQKQILEKRMNLISDGNVNFDEYKNILENEIANWEKLKEHFHSLPSSHIGFRIFRKIFLNLENETESLVNDAVICLKNVYIAEFKANEVYEFVKKYKGINPDSLKMDELKMYSKSVNVDSDFKRWKAMGQKERELAESLNIATSVQDASNAILKYWKGTDLQDTLNGWFSLQSTFLELTHPNLNGFLDEIKKKVLMTKVCEEFAVLKTTNELAERFFYLNITPSFESNKTIITNAFGLFFCKRFSSECEKKKCKEIFDQWNSICNRFKGTNVWESTQPVLQKIFYVELQNKLPAEVEEKSFIEILNFWKSLQITEAKSLLNYSANPQVFYPISQQKPCRDIFSEALKKKHEKEITTVKSWDELLTEYWIPIVNFDELESERSNYENRVVAKLDKIMNIEFANKSCAEMQNLWENVRDKIGITGSMLQNFTSLMQKQFERETEDKSIQEFLDIWNSLSQNVQNELIPQFNPGLLASLEFEFSDLSCLEIQKKWQKIQAEILKNDISLEDISNKYYELFENQFKNEIEGTSFKDILIIINGIDFDKISLQVRESILKKSYDVLINEIGKKSAVEILEYRNTFPHIRDVYIANDVLLKFKDLLEKQVESEIGEKNIQDSVLLWKDLTNNSLEENFPEIFKNVSDKITVIWQDAIQDMDYMTIFREWKELDAEGIKFLRDVTKEKIESKIRLYFGYTIRASEIIPYWKSVQQLHEEDAIEESQLSDEILASIIIPAFESRFKSEMLSEFSSRSFFEYVNNISKKLENASLRPSQSTRELVTENFNNLLQKTSESLIEYVSLACWIQNNSSEMVQLLFNKLKEHIQTNLNPETLQSQLHGQTLAIIEGFKYDMESLGIKMSEEIQAVIQKELDSLSKDKDVDDGGGEEEEEIDDEVEEEEEAEDEE